jgi:hypothetical protein
MTTTIVEVGRGRDEASLRSRWSHYFILIYCVVCFVIAINLRNSVINATTTYNDVQSGIRAEYPQNWLIDSDGEYVFRVRDATQIGFKTTIQVSVRPVSLNTTTRNLLDALSLDRAQTLTGYRVLSIESRALADESLATQMLYTYVDVQAAPILQTIPTVVEGLDVIAIQQGQAVIVSFLADANVFDSQTPIFDRFIETLGF